MSYEVTIAGLDGRNVVTIEAGSPLADVIDDAKAEALESGTLQARVNGETVDAATFTPGAGDTVVLVPPDVKLG